MGKSEFSNLPNSIAKSLATSSKQLAGFESLSERLSKIQHDSLKSIQLSSKKIIETFNANSTVKSMTSRVLRRNDAVVEGIGEDAYCELNECERAAMQYAYGKGRVTTRELTAHTGRSLVSSSKTLKNLARKGFLVWHGNNPNDPSQYYSLPA